MEITKEQQDDILKQIHLVTQIQKQAYQAGYQQGQKDAQQEYKEKTFEMEQNAIEVK